MKYEDYTGKWTTEGDIGGIYIIRSAALDRGNVVRIGAGGGSGGTLRGRLSRHSKRYSGKNPNQTQIHQPYLVVRAWGLKDWTLPQINCAEHCLYRAFAIRLPAFDKDNSHFIVPASYDFSEIYADFESDLNTMIYAAENLLKAND